RNVRVLLVDDDPDALDMLRRVLEESEAEVETALSAEDALERLGRQGFDVIVSDIGMPDRDGYELIAEVRKRGLRVPALALTAFARKEDRTKALRCGYQAHLSKPVEIGELLATIGSLVGRRSPVEDSAPA